MNEYYRQNTQLERNKHLTLKSDTLIMKDSDNLESIEDVEALDTISLSELGYLDKIV